MTFLDGYAVVRKDQFDSIRCSKYEKACKKILKAEGIFENNFGLDKHIDLTTWQSIFMDLKKIDLHVIAECKSLAEPDFIIGPFKRVTQNSTSIQFYDSTGLLEDKLSVVKYLDITIVKFDDRYTKTYKKYLRTSKLTTQTAGNTRIGIVAAGRWSNQQQFAIHRQFQLDVIN